MYEIDTIETKKRTGHNAPVHTSLLMYVILKTHHSNTTTTVHKWFRGIPFKSGAHLPHTYRPKKHLEILLGQHIQTYLNLF